MGKVEKCFVCGEGSYHDYICGPCFLKYLYPYSSGIATCISCEKEFKYPLYSDKKNINFYKVDGKCEKCRSEGVFEK